MTALEARVQGNWAVVVTRHKMTSKGQTTERLRDQFFFKKDGEWKVVPEGIRSDPAVKPLMDADCEELFKWYRSHLAELNRKYLKG